MVKGKACFDLKACKGAFPRKNKEMSTLVFWVGWPLALFISMSKYDLLGAHILSYITLKSDCVTIWKSPSDLREKEVWIKWIRLDPLQTWRAMNSPRDFRTNTLISSSYRILTMGKIWLLWFSKHPSMAGGMGVHSDVKSLTFRFVGTFSYMTIGILVTN